MATVAAKPSEPVVHDPQAHAHLGVVGRGLEVAVAQEDRLGADALHPHLGPVAPQPLGLPEGGRPDPCHQLVGQPVARHVRDPAVGAHRLGSRGASPAAR